MILRGLTPFDQFSVQKNLLTKVLTPGKCFLPTKRSMHERTEIEQVLRECLEHIAGKEYQALMKREDNVMICCGLDSQHGVELACDLEARLGITIPLNENPLVADGDDKSQRRARNFGEVVDYLVALAN